MKSVLYGYFGRWFVSGFIESAITFHACLLDESPCQFLENLDFSGIFTTPADLSGPAQETAESPVMPIISFERTCLNLSCQVKLTSRVTILLAFRCSYFLDSSAIEAEPR
jgi:hypothetical protein